MIENKYIKEFKECGFKQAVQEFWENTGNHITADFARITEQIRQTFAEIFMETAKAQELGMGEAGQITVSLIRVSAWEENKRARIDVYDQDQIVGKLIYTQDMDISWIFSEWDSFRQKLLCLAEKANVQRYVKASVIQWMMEEKLKDLAGYLCSILKYVLLDADQFPNFNLMKRRQEFYISAGEYQDWQKVLFASLPEADILNAPEDYPLLHQKIEQKIYKGKQFLHLNLEKVRFLECQFVRCTFEDVNLNDVRFIRCTFLDVEMKSGTMYGAAFENCKITNLDVSGIKKKWVPFETGETEYEVYRETVLIDCDITGEEKEQ